MKIKSGDKVFIEDAWEDEAGQFHDEVAQVVSVDELGFVQLKFDREDVTKWLSGCQYHVDDLEVVGLSECGEG